MLLGYDRTLVDITNNIVVSLSSTATSQKIESSLQRINPNYSGYAFKFISISKDATKLRDKGYSTPYKLKFSPAEDIYDVQALLELIFKMKIDPLRGIYEFLKKELDSEVNPERLKPIDRLKNYLHYSNNWKHVIGEEQNSIFHYEQFPEFTIVENDNFYGKYNEPWVFQFPDKQSSSRLEYFTKHNSTILAKIYLVLCDGGRFLTAEPREWSKHSPPTFYYKYYFINDSIEYLLAQIVTTVEHPNNCRAPSIYKEFEMYESEEEASRLIETDFAAGMRQYIYYSFDEKAQRYSRIEKGVSSPINQ